VRRKKVQSPKIKVGGRRRGTKETKAGRWRRLSFYVSRLLDWFTRDARDLPWRRTRDPYAVWVSEIMLQQTQVKTVIPYFERWMRELPTIEALANASSDQIHKLWEGLGYYTRVRNMQKAARVMMEQHGEQFPTSYDEVLALPGVGRYTAGAICSIAFNQPTPILDGNVMRVLARAFGIRGNVKEKATNERLWKLSAGLVAGAAPAANRQSPIANSQGAAEHGRPAIGDRPSAIGDRPSAIGYRRLAMRNLPSAINHQPSTIRGPAALNQALMELGATVCTPRQPRCESCPLTRRCVARQKQLVDRLPNLGPRAAATPRRFIACVLERDGTVLVRRRPAGVVNSHLWEFPNIEVPLKDSPNSVHAKIEAELGCTLDSLQPLATVKHTITRYRITLEAFRGTLNGTVPQPQAGEWLPLARARELAFTSAHGRILRRLAPDLM